MSSEPGMVENIFTISSRTLCAEGSQNGFMKVSSVKRETLISAKNGITQRSSLRALKISREPRTVLYSSQRKNVPS